MSSATLDGRKGIFHGCFNLNRQMPMLNEHTEIRLSFGTGRGVPLRISANLVLLDCVLVATIELRGD